MKKLKTLFSSAKTFFTEDLWVKDISGLPAIKRFLLSIVRIAMIVSRGFSQDNCTLQASALTYITLVSLVPILAIMFSFTKGLGMQKRLFASIGVERYVVVSQETGEQSYAYRVIQEDANKDGASIQEAPNKARLELEKPITAGIASKLPMPMQEVILRIFEYVDNTNFTALGLVGSIMLLVSVICSMAKLENSFNLIWGVKHGRSLLRKCSEYLIVLILIPVIFLFITSLNSVLFSNKAVLYLHEHYGSVASAVTLLVKIVSILVLLATFGLFFMFMPNTKVKLIPAFLAGAISFVLWLAVQWAYMRLQIGLTNFNAIYGTFAVVPFFLAWLYANWSIILLGGEISFALQNHKTMHLEKAGEHIGTGTCIVIGQLLLFESCKNFQEGRGATNISDFCIEKNIPARSMRYVVDTLCKANILIRTAEESAEMYLPGRDIARLSPADVEEAFRQQNSVDTRSYVRDLPEELRTQYEATYMGYKSKLESMTFHNFLKSGGKMRLLLFAMLACMCCRGADRLLAITGITAQNEAVEEIGAGFVTVKSLLPPGASPETYSPKARQLAICANADIFFSIGTPLEKAVLPKIQASFPNIKVWDTTEGMSFRKIEEEEEGHGHADPHVWLGIENMKVHARNVAKALASAMPDKADAIQDNLDAYLCKLKALEAKINDILLSIQGETILVFHPAFGYLLDSARIRQLAVERHGKEASARHLAELSQAVRGLKCTKLFVQPQSNPVSAAKAASILGKESCTLPPIPEHYSNDMLNLAKTIRSAFPQ